MRERELTASDRYIVDTFELLDEHLEDVIERLRMDQKLGINVSPVEGRILQFLLQMIQAKTVVEVGTLYGFSTMMLARALPENGCLHSFESVAENAEIARRLLTDAGLNERVQLHIGDARETLKELDITVDAIFIDANKGAYLTYLDWAEQHVRPGGLIIGDNTFLFGHIYGEPQADFSLNQAALETMKEFNRRLADPTKYNSVMLPTTEGMTIAQKR